ncbi:MAG: molybdopterin biosynthesis protein MoeB, partial [Flavobacteriaceae bacterium]|nr:molybdopterin biosynthesis protein MoeB [Flavobacteriaceae bacterium]
TCDNVGKRGILKIFKSDDYFDVNCEIQKEELLISSEELKQNIHNDKQVIISVIEDIRTKLPFEVNYKIPFSKFDASAIKIDSNKDYVIICNKGILSYTATIDLKNKYPQLNILSLKSGIENY